MPVPDVPWWVKLWWHGVDIAASVIATTISATVVWLFADRFVKRKHARQLEFEKQKFIQDNELKELLKKRW